MISALNRRPASVGRRLEAALLGGIAIVLSSIVLYGLRYGIRKSTRPDANAVVLTAFLTPDVAIWPFEPGDAEEAGEIRGIRRHHVDKDIRVEKISGHSPLRDRT